MQNNSYDFAELWNEALLQRTERLREPRKHVWASELGKARVDIFYAMKGIPLSNPPDPRALRKFEAGNIWEWIISLILHRAGILEECQKRVEFQYPGLLKVTGKLDFLCSGDPSYAFAETEIAALALPEVFLRCGRAIARKIIEVRTGSAARVFEIKSCSAYMFEARLKRQCASRHHKLQLYHYLKGLNLPAGEIVYVCRDDCRMMEFLVEQPSKLEDLYRQEIGALTFAITKDERPSLEREIEWDDELGHFVANWKVAYSAYLKKLYGYEDQAAFDDRNKPIVARWNRVIGRMARKDRLTVKNEAVIVEIRNAGHDVDLCVAQCGIAPEEVEERNA